MHIHVTLAATIKHAFQLSELRSALDTSFAADARAERREVTVSPISRVLFSSSSRVSGSGCFPLTLRLVLAKPLPSSSLLRDGAPSAASATSLAERPQEHLPTGSASDQTAEQERAPPPPGQPERIHAST